MRQNKLRLKKRVFVNLGLALVTTLSLTSLKGVKCHASTLDQNIQYDPSLVQEVTEETIEEQEESNSILSSILPNIDFSLSDVPSSSILDIFGAQTNEQQKEEIELQQTDILESYVQGYNERLNKMTDLEVNCDISLDEYDKVLENQKNAMKNNQQIEMLRTFINEYCFYFDFDSEKVFDLLVAMTNNFTVDYPVSVGSKSYTMENPEAYAMLFVYNIFSNHKEMGINKRDYMLTGSVVNLNYSENGKIVMRDGNTFETFLGHAADLIDADKVLVLSISDAETGGRTNRQSRVQNNFGGIGGVGHFITYPSPEAGVIALVNVVEKMVNTHSFNNLSELSGHYVNGNRKIPAPNWINNVSSSYSTYSNNMYTTFEEAYVADQRILSLRRK